MICPVCATKSPDTATCCPTCGEVFKKEPTTATPPAKERPVAKTPSVVQPDIGMTWYKLLTRGWLWVQAAAAAAVSVLLFGGLHLGSDATFLYAFYDGLKTVNTVFGVLFVISALLSAVAAVCLIGFKKNAVVLLHSSCVLTAVLTAAHEAMQASYTDDFHVVAVVGVVVLMAALTAVNAVYFKKRANLFVK